MSHAVTPSAFDSEIFGLRVGWVDSLAFDDSGFDLIFVRTPHPAALHPRASLVDVRLDLVAPVSLGCSGAVALPADEDDCAFAAELGSSAFALHSRYARDPRLCPRAPEVYRRWVRAAKERQALHVAEGRGFFCVREDADALRLDLIAVSPGHRGAGVGRHLVREFLALPGPAQRRVKVEAGNVAALNLYLHNGFTVVAAESVQHVWAEDRTP